MAVGIFYRDWGWRAQVVDLKPAQDVVQKLLSLVTKSNYLLRQPLKKLLLALTLLVTGWANAALYTTNYGATLPGYYVNDDSYFAVALPGEFFTGAPYTSANISNNGWVDFYGPSNSRLQLNIYGRDLASSFDPSGLANVHYRLDGDRAIFTWSNMGYCCYNYAERITLQLVLDASTHEVGYFYGDTGAAYYSYPGLFYNDGTQVYVSDYQSTDPLYFNWLTRTQINGFSDAVAEVPEPGSIALMALGLLGLAGLRRRKS